MKTAAHVRANITTDGVILLDIESGAIFTANTVAARIWERLLEGQSQAAIAEALAEEFKVPCATVEQDVREFVDSLRTRALVSDATRG